MKVEITGLKIKLESGEVEISVEEAKALYKQLHELFGEKVITIPSAPIIIEKEPWWPYYPTVTWQSTTPDPNPQRYPIITCRGSDVNC